ncbi:MAG: MBL fold metallo-hydrolase [Pyrinomonadaceae bacterium]
MKLVVLGSGSTVPHARRTSSAYWLETSGGNILLDAAATAPSRAAACGVDWPNLDAIWISHFHMDHCGGLGPLLAGFKHAPELRSRTKSLRIFGPRGLRDLLERLDGVNNYRLEEQRFPVEVIEIAELEKFEILPGIEAIALDTLHTDESHALHIRDGETTLVYSADTGFDKRLVAFGGNVDLLILECTFLRDKPVEKHLELAEAIFLVNKAKPKRAMLTHFYPEWDDVNFDEEIAKLDPVCEVVGAVDGLVCDI